MCYYIGSKSSRIETLKKRGDKDVGPMCVKADPAKASRLLKLSARPRKGPEKACFGHDDRRGPGA